MAVDLGSGDVWMFKDREIVPIPPPDKWSEYASLPPGVKERTDIKPLFITQPEGPSFTVDGWRVNWQRYQFRIGFTSREGVVLHQVGYKDEGSGALTGSGNIRPIAYRMSFAGACLYVYTESSLFVLLLLLLWRCHRNGGSLR